MSTDRDRIAAPPPAERLLYDHKDRLTRSDLWAWHDAMSRTTRTGAPPESATPSFEDVVAAMSDPAFYPDSPPVVEVRETATSVVFLAGTRAYKLKKPVVFPFLDYSRAEHRRLMCEREIELNRRLAPNLYLGVRPIVRGAARLSLGEGDADGLMHVIEMRRFDDSTTLAAKVSSGDVTTETVIAVAERLADFHRQSRAVCGRDAALAAVERVADGNFEALRANGGVLAASRVFAARRFSEAFVAGHAEVLAARAEAGWVCDGHGDLRAEHVLIDDDGVVQVVDCVEFDAELRTIDAGADLAFLVMDLARLGRPELGQILVNAYRHAGGDPGPNSLIAFHAATRAWVRSKIAILTANSTAAPSSARAAARAEALELFALAEQFAWHARLPLTLIVCGPPASGKSTLAGRLSEISGLPRIASDEIRKTQYGVDATQRAPESAYSAAVSDRTYAELGRRAACEIGAHGGAIVDATFARSTNRGVFAVACTGLEPPVVFECRVPVEAMVERAALREHDPAAISDAGPDTAIRLRSHFQALEDDVPASRHFVVRTDQPVDECVEDAIAMLDRRLAAPVRARPLDGAHRLL